MIHTHTHIYIYIIHMRTFHSVPLHTTSIHTYMQTLIATWDEDTAKFRQALRDYYSQDRPVQLDMAVWVQRIGYPSTVYMICIDIYIYIHMCVYIYIYTRTHTHIYIYICIYLNICTSWCNADLLAPPWVHVVTLEEPAN